MRDELHLSVRRQWSALRLLREIFFTTKHTKTAKFTTFYVDASRLQDVCGRRLNGGPASEFVHDPAVFLDGYSQLPQDIPDDVNRNGFVRGDNHGTNLIVSPVNLMAGRLPFKFAANKLDKLLQLTVMNWSKPGHQANSGTLT